VLRAAVCKLAERYLLEGEGQARAWQADCVRSAVALDTHSEVDLARRLSHSSADALADETSVLLPHVAAR